MNNRKETAPSSRALSPREPTGLILVVGVGDVIKRQESGFSRLRELGYEFCGLDVVEKPTGLDTLQPIDFF